MVKLAANIEVMTKKVVRCFDVAVLVAGTTFSMIAWEGHALFACFVGTSVASNTSDLIASGRHRQNTESCSYSRRLAVQ